MRQYCHQEVVAILTSYEFLFLKFLSDYSIYKINYRSKFRTINTIKARGLFKIGYLKSRDNDWVAMNQFVTLPVVPLINSCILEKFE